jgi:multidrug efflux pump subunit AcrA (membrane-fusion protein)
MKSFKKFKSFVTEARSEKVKYMHYEKTGKTVTLEMVNKSITKVVAQLDETRRESASANRLAQTVTKIQTRLKQLKEKEDNLKEKIRADIVDKYFDAEDAIYTRVIETNEVILSVSKETEREGSFKKDEFFAEVTTLLSEFSDQILKLKEKYTSAPVKVKSSVTVKIKEDDDKGALSAVKTYLYKLLDWFKLAIKAYDSKMEKIVKKYNQ